MLLALTGLYGLVAYNVSARTREIGIRMAIGARPGDVVGMVLRQGLWLALIGVGVGLVISLATKRLLDAAIPSTGTATVAGVLTIVPAVLMVTLMAAYLPARRASRIDPVRVLHHE